MKFSSASAVEQLIWQMRLSDFPRSLNRAKINALFNGAPPFTFEETETNNIGTNVNDLSSTVIDHNARRQLWNAFCVPDPLFSVDVDFGPVWRRRNWGQIITKAWNRPVRKSSHYLELRDSVGAGMILHGVGPTVWDNKHSWCGSEVGIEDVLIPSNTYRSLVNLPFFCRYKQFTANQLIDLTQRPKVDPGWNMELVNKAIEWVDSQANVLLGMNWPEVWSPEKIQERYKQDSGLYASDAVPTVDVFDFYFWHDNGKKSGWCRRMVLDVWGQPGAGGLAPDAKPDPTKIRDKMDFSRGNFLYNSGDRVYAADLKNIIHFQFGDASAVAPFRYHSVRSLGFLLFAVCHLQNRLQCRLADSAFEAMMQYFRVSNPTDMDRLSKIDLVDKGFIPEGMDFVKAEDRWKVDVNLVREVMTANRQSMSDISSGFSQDYEPESGEESATMTNAKVQTTAQLVGSMLNRAYAYEEFRYQEMVRRFCIVNSRDPEVRVARAEILSQGVPEEALQPERLNVRVNKVIGDGNKMLQTAIAEKLMAARVAFAPQSQQEILRLWVSTLTDDYRLAGTLVPETQHISDAVHDTQLVFGAIMAGGEVTPRPGGSPIEIVDTMIQLMGNKVHQIMQSGGVGAQEDVQGLMACSQYVGGYLQQLAQDKSQKAIVKRYGDLMGELMNHVKAFAQRQAEQRQQQNGAQGGDPAAAAKAQSDIILAQTKAKIASDSHAQKTAQRQLTFEQKTRQEEEKHRLDMEKEKIKTVEEVHNRRALAFQE